jgi:ABC-type lipoprotein release transport system permease subunit
VVSERESAGVTLLGIQPDKEQTLSFIAGAVKQGQYLTDAGDDGLLLGRKLAERLETGLGKRVVVMSQGQGNEIADRGFRVVGIFDATVEDMETAYLFTGLGAAQAMLGIGEQISEIALKAPRHDELETLLSALREAAPDDEVLSWLELEPLLKMFVGVIDAFLVIWYVIVFLLMSFGLINTLLMAIFERTREIGLLLALGMPPRAILGQVLLESIMLLMLGLLLGNGLVLLNLWWLADGIDLSAFAEGLAMMGVSPVLYPTLAVKDVVIANVVVVVLGIVASLYPAWRASRTVPVDAINQT